MAYGFWDCWIHAGLEPALFYHAVIYLMMSAASLTDSDCCFRDPADTHTCSTCKHMLHPFPCFSVPLMHTNTICLYDSKVFLVILCYYVEWREPTFPWHHTHKHWKKRSVLCGIGWHISWQSQRERESHWHIGKANEKVGAEWKGGCHINFLTSVQCLPSLFSFLYPLIFFFHVSVLIGCWRLSQLQAAEGHGCSISDVTHILVAGFIGESTLPLTTILSVIGTRKLKRVCSWDLV